MVVIAERVWTFENYVTCVYNHVTMGVPVFIVFSGSNWGIWMTPIHPEGHKLLQMHFIIQEMLKCSLVPLDTLTVFVDESGRTSQSVIVWQHISSRWQLDIQTINSSPQIVELAAVVRVFQKCSSPINIVTDSAKITGIVTRIEGLYLRDISDQQLFMLLHTFFSS